MPEALNGNGEMAETKETKQSERPVVKVKPYSYQPNKDELEKDVSLDATPEELAKAVLGQVVVNVEVKKKPDS